MVVMGVTKWLRPGAQSWPIFEAMILVEGGENRDVRQWMHLGVLKEMVRNDLDGAIAYSEKNVKSRARGEQMDRIVEALMDQRGEQGLIDWVKGIDHTVKENDMIIIDFWAPWCAPCKTFAPVFETASETYTGVYFAKVNSDERSAI